MAQPLTKTEFSFYALAYAKFGVQPFSLDSLKWHFSRPMVKKIAFVLVGSGWMKRLRKGSYRCIGPQEAVKGMFVPRVEAALQRAGMPFAFDKATAAELWSDESYMQRSWECRPFFIRILRKDETGWNTFLRKQRISFFRESPENIVGEFIVMQSVKNLDIAVHNGKPVISLDETIAFCEAHKAAFDYVLAYIARVYGKKTSAEKELLAKVGESF